MRTSVECSQHPVAFLIHGIGDTMLALPALRALANAFEGRLTLIHARAGHDFLFDGIPLRSRIPVTASGAPDGAVLDIDRAEQLHSLPCDLFLTLAPWLNEHLTKLITRLGPVASVGFHPFFTTGLAIDYSKHSAELTFDVARTVGVTGSLSDFAAPIPIPVDAVAFAVELLAQLPGNSRRLSIHMDTKPDKMWNREGWLAVLNRLMEADPNLFVLVLGSQLEAFADARYADRIVPCQGLPLSHSLALIERSDAFAGVDSCLLHGADFLRTPSAGLFGPTDPAEFGFLWTRHVVVRPRSQAMADLGASEVAEAIGALLPSVHQECSARVSATDSASPAGCTLRT